MGPRARDRRTGPHTDSLRRYTVGEYQIQVAIAAVHDQAAQYAATDWPAIVALYGRLERITGNPMVTLNRAVAVAMADGPCSHATTGRLHSLMKPRS